MKSTNRFSYLFVLLLFLLSTPSCTTQQQTITEEPVAPPTEQQAETAAMPAMEKAPASLPIMYQQPAYMVDSEVDEEIALGDAESVLKVGASIRSTRGPQPLWDIIKRLASLKKMNVSWASDVDQNVLVDVDINATDDFYEAIDNLLRQVDYFHEMQGNTIVVKYKETRQFRIAMPFTKYNYKTGTGGNMLGSQESTDVDGTIELKSESNEFDIWTNIQENMDAILATWSTTVTDSSTEVSQEDAEQEGEDQEDGTVQQASRQISSGGNSYIIDKPVGVVTVTAPRPLLNRIQEYFDTLTHELYKQISIEAKIIEVQLVDNSSIGINWNQVLNNFNVTGTVFFGGDGANGADIGQVWPYVFSNDRSFDDGTNHGNIYDPTRFISKIALNAAGFELFLNALKTQGDTQVLSNPKLSVMNGQPALLSVGRNVTYIEKIDAKENNTTTGVTYTYTVETARVMSGVGMALTATILDDNEVIMNLVPVTSELEEPILYREVGFGEVGLPVVNVREMSTTVRVKDGEMLVIGGLISNVEDTEGNFAPLVGEIPVLRYLFGYEEKKKEKRELIILLKPRII